MTMGLSTGAVMPDRHEGGNANGCEGALGRSLYRPCLSWVYVSCKLSGLVFAGMSSGKA